MFHCIPFIFYLYTVFLILHRLSTNKSVFFITRITCLIKCFIYIEISCFVFNCIKWIYKNVITWIYRSNQYSLYIKYLLIIDRLISIKFILEISAIWHRFFQNLLVDSNQLSKNFSSILLNSPIYLSQSQARCHEKPTPIHLLLGWAHFY